MDYMILFSFTSGGLDDYLRSILLLCDQYELPKIFAMTRHGLGKTLKKKAPVSIIGIFNYDGAQVCKTKKIKSNFNGTEE